MQIETSGYLTQAEPETSRAVFTFPALLQLSSGELLATMRVGRNKEGDDEYIELIRSSDSGQSWGAPETPFGAVRVNGHSGSLKLCYLTEIEPGRILAAAMWVDRDAHPGKPLFNPVTEGCLPMAILLSESGDAGRSWSDWRVVPLPEDLGPPSLTSPILKLGDGRLAMSIETNKTYFDTSPWKQKAVFFWSEDKGATWSGPEPVAEDPESRIFNWDLRCGVAPDGRMASFAWTYDSAKGAYLDIHRRVSADNGLNWSAPEPLGFADQAGRPAMLGDGRVVLPWVDRFGSGSVRARSAASVEAAFAPETETVLYEHSRQEPDGQGDTGALLADMEIWSYGLPYAEALGDGTVLIAWYAGDSAAMHIQWARIRP